MKKIKVAETQVWKCPKCGTPLEITPAHDNRTNEEIVIITCWCGYNATYKLV